MPLVMGLLAVLLVGSVVAARAIRVTLVASHGAMADLLPASTVLYAGVNLDPAGSQGDNLRAIEHAFSSEPGWDRIQKTIDAGLASSGQGKGGKTDWKSLLDLTDRRFAVAVTDPSALLNTTAANSAAQNALVVIVGLKVQASLADIVTSHHIGVPTKADTYHGVDLYRIDSSQGGGDPGYGAIINGYAVIAATKTGVMRVVDVQQGRVARLSDSPRYKQLAGRIDTNGLVFAYIDTPALLSAEPGSSFAQALSGSTNAAAQAQVRALQKRIGAMGFAVSAQSGGLDLRGMVLTTGKLHGNESVTPNHAAQALPAGTLAYLSLGNLLAVYRTQVKQLIDSGTIRQRDYDQVQAEIGDAINLLDGEIAVGLLPMDVQALQHISSSDTTSLPLAVLVDVSKHPNALSTIQLQLDRLYPNDLHPLGLRPGSTAHGSALYNAPAGYGYALVKNWLVISPAISRVAADLEGVLYGGQPNLAASDPFQQTQGVQQGAQAMVMLLNLAATRSEIETGLLPTLSPSDRQQYQDQVRPLLAPLRVLTVQSGEAADGSSADMDVFLGIGP